jgi:superfamily II DNA or RNA helicase
MKVSRKISIGYDELSEREWQKLFRALTFVNGDGEVVECWRQIYTRERVDIPRGAWNLVEHLDYVDKRVRPYAPELKFTVQLDDVSKDERFGDQSKAVASMFEKEQGQIIRPPGTGKSQIVLAFAAQCKTTCLVIVHTEDILQQWIRYAEDALPGTKVGVIRGQTCDVQQLTIGTIQTLRRFAGHGFWEQFGAVIADEAHHGAAPSWEAVLNLCPAYYRFGMTASETRADGMHPALNFTLGPIIHKQKFSSPVKLKVQPVKSSFYFGFRGPFDWMPMLNRLIKDDKRNQQIADIANEEIQAGNSVLVLSRRIEHLERISLKMNKGEFEILTGKRPKEDRKSILEDFRDGTLKCVLATQLADEALDVPRLNRVVLTHPGKHEGRLIQQIGRAIRQHPDKTDAVIYDVFDGRVGVLRRQWAQRKQAYKKAGIKVKSLGRLI